MLLLPSASCPLDAEHASLAEVHTGHQNNEVSA